MADQFHLEQRLVDRHRLAPDAPSRARPGPGPARPRPHRRASAATASGAASSSGGGHLGDRRRGAPAVVHAAPVGGLPEAALEPLGRDVERLVEVLGAGLAAHHRAAGAAGDLDVLAAPVLPWVAFVLQFDVGADDLAGRTARPWPVSRRRAVGSDPAPPRCALGRRSPSGSRQFPCDLHRARGEPTAHGVLGAVCRPRHACLGSGHPDARPVDWVLPMGCRTRRGVAATTTAARDRPPRCLQRPLRLAQRRAGRHDVVDEQGHASLAGPGGERVVQVLRPLTQAQPRRVGDRPSLAQHAGRHPHPAARAATRASRRTWSPPRSAARARSDGTHTRTGRARPSPGEPRTGSSPAPTAAVVCCTACCTICCTRVASSRPSGPPRSRRPRSL